MLKTYTVTLVMRGCGCKRSKPIDKAIMSNQGRKNPFGRCRHCKRTACSCGSKQ